MIDLDYPVSIGLIPRHLHDGEHVAAGVVVDIHDLPQARNLGPHEVIGEYDRERLIADEFAGTPNGMSEPQWHVLTRIGDVAGLQHERAQFIEPVERTTLLEGVLKLRRPVEMVFDRLLAAPRYEDQVLDPGCPRFLHCILDKRLVNDREHFLRHSLGRRQEPRSEATHGKHRLTDSLAHGQAAPGPGSDICARLSATAIRTMQPAPRRSVASLAKQDLLSLVDLGRQVVGAAMVGM